MPNAILSSLDGYDGPVLIERIAFLLKADLDIPAESKRECAIRGLQHLLELGCTTSPHWNLFCSYAGGEAQQKSTVNRQIKANEVQRKVLEQKYSEALHELDSRQITRSNFFSHTEQRLRILLLSRDYKSVIAVKSYIDSGDENAEILGEDELGARDRVHLLIVFAYFLEGAFLDCCVAFFGYLAENRNLLDTICDSRFTSFISRDEMLLAIAISCLVVTPMDRYEGFMFSHDAQQLLRLNPLLFECLELLRSVRFREFFKIWNGTINLKCRSSPFLDQTWEISHSIMRSKVLFLYTKLASRVPLVYLSRILGVDEELVREDIRRLVELEGLNLEIKGDILVNTRRDPLSNVVRILEKNGKAIQARSGALRVQNLELSDYKQGLILSTDDAMMCTVHVGKHDFNSRAGIGTHVGNVDIYNEDLGVDPETLEFDEED